MIASVKQFCNDPVLSKFAVCNGLLRELRKVAVIVKVLYISDKYSCLAACLPVGRVGRSNHKNLNQLV